MLYNIRINFKFWKKFESTNPQYDDSLLIELQIQYMKIPSSNLGRTGSAKRRASDKDLPVLGIYKFRHRNLKMGTKVRSTQIESG